MYMYHCNFKLNTYQWLKGYDWESVQLGVLGSGWCYVTLSLLEF